MTKLCKRLSKSNGKEIPSYGCGQMDKCRFCFAHNNVKALCGMLINSWAILGFDEHVVCFRHNIHDGGCNYMFNNVFHDVWCVIEFMYHSMHVHFIYNHILPMMGVRYLRNLDFVGPLSLTIQDT